MPIKPPEGTERAHIKLLQGDKRIDVTVAEAKPTPRNLVGDAFLDVGEAVTPAQSKAGVIVDGNTSRPTHYIGTISSYLKQGFHGRLTQAVFAALKRAGRDGMRSAWVNASDVRLQQLPVSMPDALISIIEGVRMYAWHVRDDEPAEHIADIIVGGGETVLYAHEMEYGRLDDMLQVYLGEMTQTVRMDKALATADDPTTTRWLEMIGNEIASMARDADGGFHRVSPTAPVMPRRSFTVVFDTQTGEPHSVTSQNIPLDPDQLPAGMAAATVYYFDTFEFIDPSEHLIASQPLSQRAMDILASLMGKKPIAPRAGARIAGVRDGVEIIGNEADNDELNSAFVEALISGDMNEMRMTMGYINEYVSVVGVAVLTDWLIQRTGLDEELLDKLVFDRVMGHQQFDIHVDRAGRFIGGVTYMDMDHSARGTQYTKGKTTGAAAIARQIAVHAYVADDGSTHTVPVLEGAWEGDEGLAKRSFDRWYHSEAFERMRAAIFTQDDLSRAVFADIGPKKRLVVFHDYLQGDDEAMKRLSEAHAHVGAELQVRRHGRKFTKMMTEMARDSARRETITKSDEVGVMYIEMLMRKDLGDEKVDELLRAGSPSSPNGTSSPNDPKALPPAGGVPGGQMAGSLTSQGMLTPASSVLASTASMMTMFPKVQR